ncbi:MAG: glycerophosphodiester phosphodiesterase, partial [Chloroflexota bacterium]
DMVELDVVAARDDEPVLFHDGSLSLRRLCGVDRSLRDLSAAELGQIHYRASDQPILSLAAALDLCRELQLGVMLDLKAPSPSASWFVKIAALLRESGLTHAAMSLSFQPLAREYLEELVMQRIAPEMVAGEDLPLAGQFWFGLPEDLPEALIDLLHRRGALVIPAINTFRYPAHAHQELARDDINRLLASGVDGFQADGVDGTYLGVGE